MNQAEKFKRLDELLGAVKAQPNVNSFADRLRGCMSAEPDTVASLVREMSMMSRAERIVVRTLFNEPGVTLDQTLWFHRHFDRLVLRGAMHYIEP